jgi:hypothetical protein
MGDITLTCERSIVSSLVKQALKQGLHISVYDGEEYTVCRSRDYALITKALRTTDEDRLFFSRPDGSRVGWVLLIYGNSYDVISDCSDNDATEALVNAVRPVVDRWERRLG